jgi:hypothetical protein
MMSDDYVRMMRERVEALAISWGYDPYAKALKAALKGDP